MEIQRSNLRPNSLEICITAYNEFDNLPKLKELVESLLQLNYVDSALIVDNGSSDDSFELLSSWERINSDIKVIKLEKNLRYGGGMATAIYHSSADSVCLLPADDQYSLDDIAACLRAYSNGSKLFVHGQRIQREDPIQIRLLSFLYRNLVWLILGVRVSDVNGLPKIFPRRAVEENFLTARAPQNANFDAALLLELQAAGLRFQSVPVRFSNRSSGSPSWTQGPLRVGFRMLIGLVKARSNWIRFNRR